jgi:hypothetical protein
LRLELLSWWVDPNSGGLSRWLRSLADEAVWVGAEGVIEGFLASGVYLVGLVVVDLVGCHQADTQMVVFPVVPVEKA